MKLLMVLSVVVIVSAGEDWLSPSSCPCGKIYLPVCASNGVSYNNMCEFRCADEHYRKSGVQIYVLRAGRCDEPPYPEDDYVFLFCLCLTACLAQWAGFAEKDCLCTSQYDPVCGTDRRRYYNICTYQCRLDYIRKNGLPMIDTMDCRLLPPPSPIH